MAALVVIGPGDPGDPDWVEARSVAGIAELARAGHTVVVTPAALVGNAGATGTGRTAGTEDAAGSAVAGEPRAGNAAGHTEQAADATGHAEEAAELAVAAVCVWAGARVLRTTRPGPVRQAAEMADALAGRRPPALTRRGLA
ncbi:hypothetical protein [Streptosporangium sandarakinum]|uniref:hypothetical protein n=1 Tax=Streptosporangium sandarakinum TaxID=1260955 RepID=UPI003417CAA1